MEYIIITGIFLLVFLISFFIKGLRTVPQEERWVIEMFRKFYAVKGPGLIWLCPLIMRIKRKIPSWEYPIELFSEKEIWLNFKDGGSTRLKGMKIWIEVDDYEAATYEVEDYEEFACQRAETVVRDYINEFPIEEVIENKNTEDILKKLKKLNKEFKKKGFRLTRISLPEFDLSEEVREKRRQVFEKQKDKEMAPKTSDIRAEETIGSVIQMMAKSYNKEPKEIKQEIESNPELKKEFRKLAEDLIKRRMAIDGKSFTDIRVQGAEGFEKGLINLIAVWKKMGAGGLAKEKTEKEKKKKPEEMTGEEAIREALKS